MYGIKIYEKDRLSLMVSHLPEHLIKTYHITDTVQHLKQILDDEFDKYFAKGVPLLPGAASVIKKLATHYPLAIGTGSQTRQVRDGLEPYNLNQYFKIIVGEEHIKNSKPAPDTYLEAARQLNVLPTQCVVLEDQPRGIQAAKNANMKCIAVPNNYLPNLDYSSADLVVNSLEDISVDTIKSL